VKLTFVCFLLVCVSPSPAQESSPWAGDRVDVQRLFKFSGTLPHSQRAGVLGAVSVRFTLYKEPDGGDEAYWQETQDVHPDVQGRYTVLLGDATLGGLPADIFTSSGRHWLGVRPSGQPEQPRILLVEMPSAWKADAVDSSPPISGAPVRKSAMLPVAPSERYIALLLLIMFLAGAAMACGEVVKWWKRRTELYGEGPLANLFSAVPGPDKLRRTAKVLRFPLAVKFSSIRWRFQHSSQTIDIDNDNDRPAKIV
jgi:hypothetical protein